MKRPIICSSNATPLAHLSSPSPSQSGIGNETHGLSFILSAARRKPQLKRP